MIFTLNTTNVKAGTTISYTVKGTGAAANQTQSGTFTVDSSGVAVSDVISVPSNSVNGDSGTLTLALANGKATSAVVSVTDSTPAPVVVAKNIVLTTVADTGATATGTSVADTFSAVVVDASGAGTTFQAGANLNGGDGTDALNLSLTGAAGALTISGVQTTSVETINVTDYTDANVVNIDASLFAGVTGVNLFASSATGDLKVSGLNNIVAAGMSNGSGDLELAYAAAAVAGKADNQTLAVSNVTAGAFAVNGAEKLSITSSLTDNTLTSVTSVASISVDGTKGLTITNALGTGTKTFDASNAAGAVVVGFTAGADVNAKGGAGNDVFDFAGGLTKDDTIDGGAGTNTVKTAETANRTYTGVNLTNVQTLDVAVTTNTLTDLDIKALADTVGVTVRAGTDDKDVTVNNVGVGQVVTVVNDSANTKELGDVAVNLESNVGTSDAVSVALSAASSANQTLDLLTIDAGAESASIANSGAGSTNKFTLTSLIADGAKTISFTGSGNFATTLNESAGGANVTTTIDASAATGTFGFTEGVTNDLTIKGSAGANTIVMASTLNNKDTIIGGASTKDTVSATIGAATTATTGKFNLTGIENLALTTTDGETAVVDLSASTGVTAVTLAASGAAGSGVVTIKGLAAGTTVSATEQAANDFDGTLTVALADATGTADAITIGLNNSTTSDNFTLVAAGIETVTLSAAATGINAGSSLDVSGVAATKLVVTGGVAASGLDLTQGATKLNKTVTSVDTSGFSGAITVKASTDAAASGVAVNAGTIIVQNGGAVDTFVGTTATGKVDSFTGKIGATSAGADFITQLSNFETYDITFADGVAVTASANQGLGDGDNVVTSIKLSGGLASSTYTATGGYIDGQKLTSFDASGLGGAISIQVDAGASTGTLNDLGSKLTIKGSTNATTDKVEYLTNGLAVSSTSTTGKLLTSGVETVVLTTATAASTVDATGLVGVKTIAVENGQIVTLKNIAAGTALQLGNVAGGTVDEYSGTLTFSLADATGTSDNLNVTLVNTSTDNETNATLVETGIETVGIAAGTSATSSAILDVSGVAATKIVLTKGLAGEVLDLRGAGTATLNAATATLDGSAFAGGITAIANINIATTVSAKTAALTFTGSDLNDSVTVGAVGSEIGAAITSLDLGNGTGDTLTAYVADSASLVNVTNTETINLVAGTGDMSVTGTSGANGVNQASAITVTGGESGKVVTLGGSITDHVFTLDASTMVGSVAMTFGDDALLVTGAADPIVIKGGLGSKDKVTATFAAATNTGSFTMSGVETLAVNTTRAAGVSAATVNLAGTTGLSNITLTTGAANANSVTVSGLSVGTTVSLGSLTAAGQQASDAFQGVTATLNLASATGTADALTVNLNDTNAGGSTATIATNGVESLTLALGNTTEDHLVVLNNTNTNAATLTVTGTNTSADLTVTTFASAYTTVDASGLKGSLVMSDGSRGATAMNITGGSGVDTIIMRSANDVLDGGTAGSSGKDVLKIVGNLILGGILVDLTSATDQVTTYNGSANAAVQKGFESVDLSGVTGTFGADITAVKTGSVITGTANADQITLGAGVDTVAYSSAAQFATKDTIVGFTAHTDKIQVAGALLGDGNTTLTFTTHPTTGTSEINVFTTALADNAAVITSIQAATQTTPSLFVVYNTASGEAQIWYDANANVDGGETLIASLVGVTAANIATLVAADFVLV